jgi:predicted PurR-regulated permease PerM
MCFVVHAVSHKLLRVFKIGRRVLVLITYVLFIFGLLAFIKFGVPKMSEQAALFSTKFQGTITTITNEIKNSTDDPELSKIIGDYTDALNTKDLGEKANQWVLSKIANSWHYVTWFFVSLVFSFLIIMELPELMQKFRSLRFTRLHVIYDETVSSVILFGKVVGENFRAQILISLVNTVLTVVGLLFIGVGYEVLLAVIVFSCGLVPVLGVFISSVPIMLIAINAGEGELHKFYLSLGLIAFIHIVEAYVLNPRIISSVHRLNPVITLMILYIAHSLMGMWGMFLGIPISVYIYRQLILPKQNGVKVDSSLQLEGTEGSVDNIPDSYFGDDVNGFEVPYFESEDAAGNLELSVNEDSSKTAPKAKPKASPQASPKDSPKGSTDSPEASSEVSKENGEKDKE